MAFLPLRSDGRGFPFAAVLSVLAVFAVTSHQPWGERLGVEPEHVVLVAGVLLCGTWALTAASRTFGAALALLIGLGLTWWLATAGTLPGVGADGGVRVLAWPWFVPLGSTIAFTWTLLLSGRRARAEIKA